jgi:hypothetical protein
MMKKVLFFGLALAMATTAFAADNSSVGNSQVLVQPTQVDGSLPTNVLLIMDQYGWGFTSVTDILNNAGVSYTIINSGQIGSTSFAGYDKIITPGQQPDNFYYAIQSNTAKFEDFMNAGYCISFETANYFGGANEFITWPGGFQSPNNGGSNALNIDDANHPLLAGVNNAELQNWNFSAHGVHTNLPGNYWSALSTIDGGAGSCAGSFDFGGGGAAVANQPLEWGYGFGYSQVYVPNFYLFECGGGPVATESTTWGAVKALYR